MARNQVKGVKFDPPQTLKKKVGPARPGGVNETMLKQAEQAIGNLTAEYLDDAKGDIAHLRAAFTEVEKKNGDGAAEIKKLYQASQDIKAKGGSFGYQLMSLIGDELCQILDGKDSLAPMTVAVAKLHVDALTLVAARDIKGDGGKVGQELLKGLGLVAAKAAD